MSYHPTLKGLRARWCLSQEELADLLGVTQARISRYEKNDEFPSLGTALALQVVFNIQPKVLFRSAYDHMEDGVMQRAAVLERALGGRSDYGSQQKLHLFKAMMDRATNQQEA